MGEGRQNEILGVLFATLSIILLLALLTYSPTDPGPFSRSSESGIHNLIGSPGAWVADLVFQFFGFAGYLIPFLVLIACFAWLKRRPIEAGLRRFLGSLITLLCTCGLLSILGTEQSSAAKSGGIVGHIVAAAAMSLGKVGGAIVLIALLVVGLLLATEIRLQAMGALFRRMKAAILHKFAGYLKRLGDWVIVRRSGKMPPKRRKRTARAFDLENEKTRKRPLSAKETKKTESLKPAESEEVFFDSDPAEVETYDEVVDSQAQEFPPIKILEVHEDPEENISREEIERNYRILEQTLLDFGIEGRVVGFQRGPVITRYEIEPPPGVKVNRITGLTDNLALSLKASPIRVVAPIPGKGTVGVEVPNRVQQKVYIRQLIDADEFETRKSKLTIALGKTLSGEFFYADLKSMPHLLIAGATGAGKSVCINTIITSLLYRANAEEVKFLLVDPKRVELSIFSDIPHLMAPVITDGKRAGAALRWVVEEMEDRFIALSRVSCRNIDSYNTKMAKKAREGVLTEAEAMVLKPFLPYIVVIIDELADLMTYARNDTEVLIASLAQKARAVGIHLVIATQRPSVNVITGVIKANFPSRIAFQVASKVDSRTILDANGAEALLGRGDMLFSSATSPRAIRLQGSFITAEEVERVCEHLKKLRKPAYLAEDFDQGEEDTGSQEISAAKQATLFDIPLPSELEGENKFPEDVDLFDMAKQIVLETGSASTSMLQRRLKIGYGRAARFLDQMEQEGLVGPPRGSRPRVVLAGGDEDDES